MARERSDDEERQRRRERRQGGGGSSAPAPGGAPAGEYDADEVRRMVEQSIRTRSVAAPGHFSSRRAWQEYLHSLPQDVKAEYKGRVGARDREVDAYLRQGKDFGGLGIRNVKEEGQARYRRMGMHNLDKSFSYDWEKGVKYNIATSDDNEYMRPQPITDDDYREYAEVQRYGATPEGYAARLRDATRNQMNTWAQQNAVKGGTLRKDEQGRLYMTGNQGERYDFDEYGNLIDANTGQPIGNNQYGMGTDLLAAGAGYVSPYAVPGATPTLPGGGWTPEHTPKGVPGMPVQQSLAAPGAAMRPGVGGPTAARMIAGGGGPTMARPSMGNAWNRTAAQGQPSQGGGGQAQPTTGAPGVGRPQPITESVTMKRTTPLDQRQRRQAGGSVLANPYA